MTGLFLFLEDVPALIQGLRPAGGESQILSQLVGRVPDYGR